MSQFAFNAANVDPTDTFQPIPAGVYLAHVTDSEVKPTKAGSGEYIAMTLEILDGQYKGRKVFTNINVRNSNATAEQIGQKALSQLCHAVGVLQLTDTAQLHGRPFRAKVTIRKDDGYGDKNEVRGFESASATAAPAGAPAQAQPAPTQAPRAPWEKAAA